MWDLGDLQVYGNSFWAESQAWRGECDVTAVRQSAEARREYQQASVI